MNKKEKYLRKKDEICTKHNSKNQSAGITLIALVVTIIVLIILAGISINLILGENGIIKKATAAKDETKIASEKELVELAVQAAKMETEWGALTEENLEKELTNNIGKRDEKYTLEEAEDKFIITYIDTNRSYIVNKDGDVAEKGQWYMSKKDDGTVIVTNGTLELIVGDYIDYDPITGATEFTYTSEEEKNGYTDQTYTLVTYNEDGTIDETAAISYAIDGKWVVIGASEEGEILIAPEGELKVTESDEDEYFYLEGQAGYQNAITELDNISKLYGQGYGATGARSITVEDVNKVTGYDPETAKYDEGYLSEYGNEVTYYWDGTNYPYYTYTKADGTVGTPGKLTGDHATNYNKKFNWFDFSTNTWKESEKATITPEVTDGDTTKMQYITKLTSDYYYYDTYDIELTSGTKNYNAIFNGDDADYWLASRCIGTYSCYASFRMRCVYGDYVDNYDLFNSNGYSYDDYYRVRPAVSLKSDIQLTGSSEEGWSIQ